MNRTYLQALAILMGTAATTFLAAEWRWEPANAGRYLVIFEPVTDIDPDRLKILNTRANNNDSGKSEPFSNNLLQRVDEAIHY